MEQAYLRSDGSNLVLCAEGGRLLARRLVGERRPREVAVAELRVWAATYGYTVTDQAGEARSVVR